MRKLILTMLILIMSCSSAFAGASLDKVNSWNYLEYEKDIPAPYGYNKGDEGCVNDDYLPGEELFYTDGYDHWNVVLVYDESLIPALKGDAKVNNAKKVLGAKKPLKAKKLKCKKVVKAHRVKGGK